MLSNNTNAQVIDVLDYGAVVNDDIDDYYAIQSAIEALDQTKNGTLIFHKGVYNINHHKIDNDAAVQKVASFLYKENFSDAKAKYIPKVTNLNTSKIDIQYKSTNSIKNFTFTNYTNLTIEGNGAIFKFDGDWIRTADYTLSNPKYTYSRHNAIGFEVISSSNVIIRNFELHGGANQTTKVATTEGFSSGIMIGGSSYVTINNVYVHHYHADGLYIYAKKESNGIKRKSIHIKVSNSRFKNNARQGCSITGAKSVDFYNCSLSNTGYTGKYGSHNPMAGADIEPHHDVNQNGYITFTKCNFVDNMGFAYVGSNSITTPYPIEFKYCTFSNSKKTIWHQAVVANSRKTSFSYCLFNEISMWPNYAAKDKNGDVTVNVSNSRFKSNKIDQKILLATGNTNLKWRIEKSTFELNSRTKKYYSTKHRFYVSDNKYVLFKSNTIKMIEEEYQTYLYRANIKFILNNATTSSNRWIKKTTPKPQPDNTEYSILDYSNGIIVIHKK